MTLSAGSLDLFAKLLDSVQLNASAPDFEVVALQVIQARKELAEIRPRQSTKPEHNGRVTKSPRAKATT